MRPFSPGEGAQPVVRAVGDADRSAIVAMLARAFADDPAMTYIFPDRVEREVRLPRLFGLLFDSDGASGMRLVTGGGEAATLWRAPGRTATPLRDMLRVAWPMWRAFGGALGRALAVSNALSGHFPDGAYWYLHVAGCEPARQGKGFGGAAVRAGLARAAAGGLPTYLETATEQNVAFYRSLGFAVTAHWRVPRGGPEFWSMLHPADRR